jgi:hypothetical protein
MERPDVDYHREKYGLVALANHLAADGWKVLLSVVPASLATPPHKGIDVPTIDAAKDSADPRYRYNFYIDRGGRHDLVATRGDEVLVVEGKGKSGKPVSGLEQLIGRSLLAATSLPAGARSAILIPDAWAGHVAAANHPALDFIEVFTVTPSGDIGFAHWGRPIGTTSG